MRTVNLSALSFVVAVSATLSACSQNPHVLGADSQAPTDRRNGPASEPGTAGPDTGSVKNPGEKAPTHPSKPHDGCVYAEQVMTFDSRFIPAKDKSKVDSVSLAIDLNFVDAQAIVDVHSARLVMYTVTPERTKANLDSSACLSTREVCGKFSGTDALSFNLLSYMEHSQLTTTLNSEKVLAFSVPADLGTHDAQLQLEAVVEKCGPKVLTQ
ncbi:MAG: hypothetical protein H7222_14175 [Methylotenera sp.]|nr:hypothetical protein [Oligoflexia bacterium]